jgi:hypothetical protein
MQCMISQGGAAVELACKELLQSPMKLLQVCLHHGWAVMVLLTTTGGCPTADILRLAGPESIANTYWIAWSMNVLMGAEPLWPSAAVMPAHHLTNRWLYR